MRLLIALLVALPFAAALAVPSATAEAAGCRFTLGFQALHAEIPAVVGDCLQNEHYNPINGDGLQRTAHGLLVWRKADNWTAFTDGYRTWVNGPRGLQERLNGERFPWERSGCSTPPSVALSGWAATTNGSRAGQGIVFNPCDDPVGVEVDLIGAAAPRGQPLVDAPTLYLDVNPGQSLPIRVSVPDGARAPVIQPNVASYDAATAGSYCFAVDPGDCVPMDPLLAGSAGALASLGEGRWLLDVAAKNGVKVTFGALPNGRVGAYLPSPYRVVVVSDGLMRTSGWARAATLARELQDAADDAAGLVPANPTPGQCLAREGRAFAREAQVWNDLWHGQLPPNLDADHAALNAHARTIAQNPGGGPSLLARESGGC